MATPKDLDELATGSQHKATSTFDDNNYIVDTPSDAGSVKESPASHRSLDDEHAQGPAPSPVFRDTDRDLEKGVPLPEPELQRLASSYSQQPSSGLGNKEMAGTVTENAPEEEDDDPNIIWWDGPDDPENPMNWPNSKKWLTIGIVSGLTFLTPLASSGFAPGVPRIMEEFGTQNDILGSFMVSIYVLGFACGPLVIAPLSEMYGRNLLYHICSAGFLIFTTACAVSSSTSMFIVFRFLAGCFGGGPITLGGGTIADITNREQRGTAMAAWLLGPTVGPAIGPILGGLWTSYTGWRWNFWFILILGGAFAVAGLVLMKETYAPTILARKTKRLQEETGNPRLRSKLDLGLSTRDLLLFSIVRPIKLLFLSPICFLLSLYVAVSYAYIYLLFTTFTSVFQSQYHFSTSVVGLSFLGLGIGSFLGQMAFTLYGNKLMQRYIRAGDLRLENRLKLMAYGAPVLPFGFFIYGWTVQYHIHWIVPICSTSLIGIGMLLTFMAANTYLVDVFAIYAASAMAANTVLRSVFAAFIPLAGPKMYQALGLGWGNSLLGFIALAMIPIPLLFIKFGERIRNRQTVKL